MDDFAKRFKQLRLEKGLQQDEMLLEFNKIYHRSYAASAISRYENDKRMPEIDALKDFAKYFGVSVSYLLGDSNIRNPDEQLAIINDDIEHPFHEPILLSKKEFEIINSIRIFLKTDYSWNDISQSLRIAERWLKLDDDGRFVVGNSIVQEERRKEAEVAVAAKGKIERARPAKSTSERESG